MYKINEIKELIRALDKSTLTEITIKTENKEQLILRKGGYVVASQAEQQVVPVAADQPQQEVVQQEAPQAAPQEKVEAPKAEVEQQAAPQVEETNLHKIVSPMVGTFYAAPAPDADPYVKVGDQVEEDTVVCIVEAMKLMNELEAEVKGEIVEILVENGQLVEYGQPLFLVKQA